MQRRSILILFSIACLAFGAWLYPLGETEREFAKLKAEARWQVCDFRAEQDRLFVLRIYNRVKPLLSYLRAWQVHQVRERLAFNLVPDAEPVNFTPPYYWADIRRELNASFLTRLRSWFLWENDIKELLLWDRARLSQSLVWPEKAQNFTPQKAVRRTGPFDFELALDPGELAPFHLVLKRVIEEGWSLPPYRLHVSWEAGNPNAFKLVLRPFEYYSTVDYGTNKIYLGDFLYYGTLVHEIGHVLGFRDHYRFYWSERACKVAEAIYDRDLMSNSAYGHALPGHWALLNKAYPWAEAKGLRRTFAYRAMDVFRDEKTIHASTVAANAREQKRANSKNTH